jgi:hypothetical protein
MLKSYILPLMLMVGMVEAKVVNDEYRGNNISYSKESYNKTTTNYWVKKKKPTVTVKSKKRYKKSRKYNRSVVNDEYRGNSVKYSSNNTMTRAQWEAKHKKVRKSKKRYKKIINDEYQGSTIHYNR